MTILAKSKKLIYLSYVFSFCKVFFFGRVLSSLSRANDGMIEHTASFLLNNVFPPDVCVERDKAPLDSKYSKQILLVFKVAAKGPAPAVTVLTTGMVINEFLCFLKESKGEGRYSESDSSREERRCLSKGCYRAVVPLASLACPKGAGLETDQPPDQHMGSLQDLSHTAWVVSRVPPCGKTWRILDIRVGLISALIAKRDSSCMWILWHGKLGCCWRGSGERGKEHRIQSWTNLGFGTYCSSYWLLTLANLLDLGNL